MRTKLGLLVLCIVIVLSISNPFVRTSEATTPIYKIYLPFVTKPVVSKGVALAFNNCSDLNVLGIGWYNYSANPFDCSAAGVTAESVAMAWGASDASSVMGGTSNWVMGFNEPNNPYGQSNLSPHDAAVAWHTFEINNPTRKLVSPGPYDGFSSPPLLTGAAWLSQFRSEYLNLYGQAPRLDALAIHCYWQIWDRGGSDCKTVLNSVQQLADSWGISEIWLTEFNYMDTGPCNITGSNWSSNMDAMKVYLNSHPKYTRFAWFTARVGVYVSECYWDPLFDENGNLTLHGVEYKDY